MRTKPRRAKYRDPLCYPGLEGAALATPEALSDV